MGSGTRAMDHGIEALCSPYGTPLADEVVLAGIRYLYDGMLKTLQDPADLEARRNSQYGSWLASFGLQARIPMGASHGIGHVLGGTCDVPHYYCTPVLMPSVLRYNMPFTENAQRRIANVLGATDGDSSAAFARLVQKLGLPQKLSDVGVGEDKFALISRGWRSIIALYVPTRGRSNARRTLSSCCASRRRPRSSAAITAAVHHATGVHVRKNCR
jgi:maleylacetate reductase